MERARSILRGRQTTKERGWPVEKKNITRFITRRKIMPRPRGRRSELVRFPSKPIASSTTSSLSHPHPRVPRASSCTTGCGPLTTSSQPCSSTSNPPSYSESAPTRIQPASAIPKGQTSRGKEDERTTVSRSKPIQGRSPNPTRV